MITKKNVLYKRAFVQESCVLRDFVVARAGGAHVAITPYLYYKDLGAALKWLTKAFGFKRYGVQVIGSGVMN